MAITVEYMNARIGLLESSFDHARSRQQAAVTRLYNRNLGPIRTLVLHRPEATDFAMYTAVASHTPVGFFFPNVLDRPRDSESITVPGGGKGGDPIGALLGALGEMSERLLGMLHFQTLDPERYRFATCRELEASGLQPLRPADLPLFAREQYADPQFPYVPFREDMRLGWVAGTNLASGETIWAPAQVVLLYYRRAPGEAPIAYPTTGGLAFHDQFERAVLHGMYEVIERDAINVGWHSHLPPRRVVIDLERVLRESKPDARPRFQVGGVTGVEVLLNTLDVNIPVFSVLAFDESRGEKSFLSGGGAWGTRTRALGQAIYELGQCRNILKFHHPLPGKHIRPESPRSELTEFFDAVVYYGYGENRPLLEEFRRGGSSITWEDVPDHPFDDPHAELEAMVERLRACGVTPLIFDLGGAAWPGVHVIKTLLPQLTQAGVPSTPFLGHPRYYDLPKQLGRADRVLTYEDLNHAPVPLP